MLLVRNSLGKLFNKRIVKFNIGNRGKLRRFSIFPVSHRILDEYFGYILNSVSRLRLVFAFPLRIRNAIIYGCLKADSVSIAEAFPEINFQVIRRCFFFDEVI